ncbi:hypothetical protein MMC15_003587 [Xylographa vitiligo]|nr:hypothetical protein [Xylographa vitiligo]
MTKDPIECIGDCGFSFSKDASTTWHNKGQDSAADYNIEPFELLLLGKPHLGYWEYPQFGSDHVTRSQHNDGKLIMKHEAVATFPEDHDSIGSFGLGPQMFSFTASNTLQPSTLHHSPGEDDTLSASYGYTAGAVYKEDPVDGSLTFGGYDASRIGAENLAFDLWPGIPQDLLVSIEAIATGDFTLLASPIVANIDSSVAQIWLPTSACQRFEEAFSLTWTEESNL